MRPERKIAWTHVVPSNVHQTRQRPRAAMTANPVNAAIYELGLDEGADTSDQMFCAQLVVLQQNRSMYKGLS
jgi:hypothetical protein